MDEKYQIITFYEFKDMEAVAELSAVKESLRSLMTELSLCGTIILASEGFNSTLGGLPDSVSRFVERAEELLKTKLIYKSSFKNAINPSTEKFNDLPAFVEKNLDPTSHKKIAMFCTGGIRCEKFVPYMKGLGFGKVYQLEGGILKYLEDVNLEESLWKGECFVFDERISVTESLEKGSLDDFSQANGK